MRALVSAFFALVHTGVLLAQPPSHSAIHPEDRSFTAEDVRSALREMKMMKMVTDSVEANPESFDMFMNIAMKLLDNLPEGDFADSPLLRQKVEEMLDDPKFAKMMETPGMQKFFEKLVDDENFRERFLQKPGIEEKFEDLEMQEWMKSLLSDRVEDSGKEEKDAEDGSEKDASGEGKQTANRSNGGAAGGAATSKSSSETGTREAKDPRDVRGPIASSRFFETIANLLDSGPDSATIRNAQEKIQEQKDHPPTPQQSILPKGVGKMVDSVMDWGREEFLVEGQDQKTPPQWRSEDARKKTSSEKSLSDKLGEIGFSNPFSGIGETRSRLSEMPISRPSIALGTIGELAGPLGVGLVVAGLVLLVFLLTEKGFVQWILRALRKPLDRMPADASDRQLVRSLFEWTAVSVLGESVRWNHHRRIAELLSRKSKKMGSVASSLADLYEKARYSPPDEEFDPAFVAAAREHSYILRSRARFLRK